MPGFACAPKADAFGNRSDLRIQRKLYMASRGELVMLVQSLMNAKNAEDVRAVGKLLAKTINDFSEDPRNFDDIRESEPSKPGLLPPGSPFRVSQLTDAQLTALNGLLPWVAPTTDEAGRAMGAPWSASKRASIQPLRDKRHDAFEKICPLAGKTVLEVGCFEGIHSISLASRGANVIAIDSRVENLLKTLIRLWGYNYQAQVELWDLENDGIPVRIPPQWDVLHHIGVLYHLSDPVRHLRSVLERTKDAVLLDTHVAHDEETANHQYEADGKIYRYHKYAENRLEPFAGMEDHAKWLLLEELKELFAAEGFSNWQVASDRAERNGRRVTIWAQRSN